LFDGAPSIGATANQPGLGFAPNDDVVGSYYTSRIRLKLLSM
jgi:hypothetical protein